MQINTVPFKRFSCVKEIAKAYSDAFSESSIRWLIFNEKTNGFSCCVKRIGRKVLIDLDQFEAWITKQGEAK
jgi:hypothetical protein